jgi:hypothetical protein
MDPAALLPAGLASAVETASGARIVAVDRKSVV